MGFDVNSKRILILSGKALNRILKNPTRRNQLLTIFFFMNRVIGYDFDLNSKAKLVSMIKNHDRSQIAAIGKGYLDLGMVTEADIGIQYSNNRFRVNYGDVVVGNLQVLKKLIFKTSG